jgi:hypothetical protein
VPTTARAKPASRRAPRAIRSAITDERLSDFAESLADACSRYGLHRTLQLDFFETGPNAGLCVLRVAVTDRSWRTTGQGHWHPGFLDAVIDRGLVTFLHQAGMGVTVRATDALLRASD